MKKVSLFGAVLLATILVLSPAVPVSAADNEAGTSSDTSQAVVQVEAGQLTLYNVPDMDFGTVTIDDVATTNKVANFVDSVVDGGNQQETGNIEVNDFRGNSAGWHVRAALSDFTSTTDATVLTGTIDLGTPAVASTGVTPGDDDLTAGGEPLVSGVENATTVFNAAAGYGQAVNTATVSTDATLTINQNSLVTPGLYTATINWELTNTPEA